MPTPSRKPLMRSSKGLVGGDGHRRALPNLLNTPSDGTHPLVLGVPVSGVELEALG